MASKKQVIVRPKVKPWDNEERTRYYGVRVGDAVTETAFGLSRSGIVGRYDPFDNNAVWVKVEGKESMQKFIPEYCTITKAVDFIEPVTAVEAPVEEVATVITAPAFTPPAEIVVSSTGCVMQYLEFDKARKLHYYKYTHSAGGTKTGSTCPFTEEDLKKFIKTNETLKLTANAEQLNTNTTGVSKLRFEDFL